MIYLLPQTIDEAAQSDPDHTAFRCDAAAISYGDAAVATNQLAQALIDQGVKSGDRVGVLMPRCIESALAVHSIMKAGAVFVPLDPHSPHAAHCGLIDYCGIRAIVTHGQTRKSLEQLTEASSALEIVIGSEPLNDLCRWLSWQEISTFRAERPNVRVLEHDLAYVMFTSGSTGRPKGIMHTHHSGLSYAKLSVGTYGVQKDDVIGSHSPLHFDMSTFGYFSGPLAAATVSFIPEAYTRLPASLSQLMESHQISIWYSVPFALIQLHLRGVLASRELSCLRWVLFGGEPFPPKYLYELMRHWPDARFSNVYGPAEVNQCTYYHLPQIDADNPPGESNPIPIGSVWPNTLGLAVDENDEPVDRGETGELLIRSSTMMQGYWGRDDLNEAAFFRRTGSSGIEEVYYRTGDLVTTDENGLYIFLGRRDRQIKLRGYRVELDAVEQALSSHPAVEEVGVFVVRDQADAVHIRATATLRANSIVGPRELAAHVGNSLPWYAVPNEVKIVSDLPRTTSGKINRQRLAEIAQTELSRKERGA